MPNQFPNSPFNFAETTPQQYQGMSQSPGNIPQISGALAKMFQRRPARYAPGDPWDPEALARLKQREKDRANSQKKFNKGVGLMNIISPWFGVINKLFGEKEAGGLALGGKINNMSENFQNQQNQVLGNYSPQNQVNTIFGHQTPQFNDTRTGAMQVQEQQLQQEQEKQFQQQQLQRQQAIQPLIQRWLEMYMKNQNTGNHGGMNSGYDPYAGPYGGIMGGQNAE